MLLKALTVMYKNPWCLLIILLMIIFSVKECNKSSDVKKAENAVNNKWMDENILHRQPKEKK